MPADIRGTTSDRLLEAAAELLRQGGVEALSTRAVAAAAGTQPPILYRRFGDKEGLIEATTLYVLEDYIQQKRNLLTQSGDPVADLRRLWDLFVAFGFAQPDCFALIYGNVRRGQAVSTAAQTTVSMLKEAIGRIADAGRLRMSVERATDLFQSCGVGFVITQLTIARSDDAELSEIARENAIDSIVAGSATGKSRNTISGRATALRQAISGDDEVPLTSAERELLAEWLDRIADKRRR